MAETASVEEMEMKVVFESFDADSSGAISVSELSAAVQKLGLVVKAEELQKMLKVVDEDNSGEVEFNEFKQIVGLAQGNKTAESAAMNALFQKKKASTPMVWQKSEKANGVKYEEESAGGYLVCSRDKVEDGSFGVALMDKWLSGQARSPDLASLILQFEDVSDECYVGFVGRNYLQSDWNHDLSKSNLAAVIKCGEGDKCGSWCSRGAAPDMINKLGNKFAKITAGTKLHVELEMQTLQCNMELLKDDNSGDVDANVKLDVPIQEIAIAICFGPGGGKVRIVGASCEVSAVRTVRRMSKDVWDSDNPQTFDKEQTEKDKGFIVME
jgi:hypothetical protein